MHAGNMTFGQLHCNPSAVPKLRPITVSIWPAFCMFFSNFWISEAVLLLVTFGMGMWWLGEQATLSVGAAFALEVDDGLLDE